jgi:periplasmic protein TonB
MTPVALEGYRAPSRAALLAMIALAHVGAVTGWLAASGRLERAIAEKPPLVVSFMQDPVAPRAPAPLLAPPKLAPPSVPQVMPPSIVLAPAFEAPRTLEAAPPAVPAASVAPAIAAATTVQPPRADLAYLRNPPPPYPALSRRLREEGRVLLRVHVDEAGGVMEVSVATSSGSARLDDAAREAVRRWRFEPARSGERPIEGWALVPVAFELRAVS